MEAIDILAIVYSLDDFLFGDVAREGELYYETVNISIAVKCLDGFEKFLFSHIVFKADKCRLKATLLAGAHLVGHVCLASPVMSYEDCGEMRALFTFGTIFSTVAPISSLIWSATFFPSISVIICN